MADRPNLLSSIAFLFIAVILAPTLAAAADRPSPWGDDPEGFRASVLDHRADEAASKERSAKALLAVVPTGTANQALYDVRHYDLILDLNPTSRRLTGLVTVTAEVTGETIAVMDLDLRSNLAVLAVTSGGAATTHTRSGDILTVTLDRSYTAGQTVIVSVSYEGNPASEYFGWSTFDGEPMIWTLSEPFGARYWWPCKDLNDDKADSVDITVTVPDGLIVASNGLLVSDLLAAPDRTFHWKTTYPISTYLVSLAIHPYVQYSDWYTPLDAGPDMEVQFFIYPAHVGVVESNYALTVPMIGAFAQGFGEYPFLAEKYGHAEFTWGGGMEHQTITSLGGWSEDLISHELAHMWWGDMITCRDFGHIWLNEGFATWSEAYWAEQQYGPAVYQQYMDMAAYYGGGTVFVEDPYTEQIFDSNLSYNKGSWIVHMLRGVLGDADFFAALAEYRARFAYGTAATADLRQVCEDISGLDLEPFFLQWVYGEYYPVYATSWHPGPGAGEITVTIEQTQINAPPFTMPIRLRLLTDLGQIDVTVQNSQQSESYVIPVAGAVEGVQLDPDRWILRMVGESVSAPTFDQGILLVNGVDWATYGAEITSAYADSAFWGASPITFWDCFEEPAAGYPANLPEPAGHGYVPAEVLGAHSTVIWIGNNYNGDLARWSETAIASYLEAGGNLLLLSRMARDFLPAGDLGDYLGVTWAETDSYLGNCVAVAGGLVNIPFIGTQSYNDVFLTAVGPETTLLFKDTAGFSGERGTGAVVVPSVGGTARTDGGRLALVAGRPYRMDHAALRANVERILEDWLQEPYDSPAAVPAPVRLPGAAMGANHPNPFNPMTVIPVSLTADTGLRLQIFDARGRLVRTLADGNYPAGEHALRWDGRDDSGRAASSGVYFARMSAGGDQAVSRGMVLVR